MRHRKTVYEQWRVPVIRVIKRLRDSIISLYEQCRDRPINIEMEPRSFETTVFEPWRIRGIYK